MKTHRWIYNLTNQDLTIHDLNCTVFSRKCLNLARIASDEEIEKSIKSGSIKSKGNKFKFGGPPKQIKSLIKISDIPMERPNKGGVIIAPETITTILDEQHENDLEYIEALIDEENE